MAQQLDPQVKQFITDATTYIARAQAALEGIKGDDVRKNEALANLQSQLDAIENSPGTLSEEDQASLNSARDSLKVLTEAAETQDALNVPTPPTPPTVDPTRVNPI